MYVQRYIARIIRGMIVSGLGFGGGFGLLAFIFALLNKGNEYAWQYGLSAGIFAGLAFGIILILVFLALDITAHLFLPKDRFEEVWELEQRREVVLDGSLKEIMIRCRQAILTVPNVGNVSESSESKSFLVSIGPSWKSGGETMEVKMEMLGENSWKLSCLSKPLSTNIVFDYGKNYLNVETWLSNLLKERQEGNSNLANG